MATALCWFRRDLRLDDNPALAAALAQAQGVVPVAVLDPTQLAATHAGEKPLAFFLAGLRALDEALRARGSSLVVRRGDPAVVLADLCRETGAAAVFAEADVSPFARARDDRVAARLPLRLVGGPGIHPPEVLVRRDGTPYTVFAQFYRAWQALPPPGEGDLRPAPSHLPTPLGLASEPIPTEPSLPTSVPFPPGEGEAERRLAAFATGDDAPIYRYAADRDRLDLDGTSRLSPYLRLGILSARRAAVAARRALAGAPDDAAREGVAWLRQLAWRDFYLALLYYYPNVLAEAQQANLREVQWADDEGAFAAWCEGRTGYPLVDTAMRQLVAEGWLHNRARLVAASFLVKDLLVDWRWGERWFMQHLVDGDPSLNNGNWQWVAGTGSDSMHYLCRCFLWPAPSRLLDSTRGRCHTRGGAHGDVRQARERAGVSAARR